MGPHARRTCLRSNEATVHPALPRNHVPAHALHPVAMPAHHHAPTHALSTALATHRHHGAAHRGRPRTCVRHPHRSSSCLLQTSSPTGYSTCCRRPCRPCLSILTEGDSKVLTVAGGVVGHDDFGIFPLHGKLLNARGKARSDHEE